MHEFARRAQPWVWVLLPILVVAVAVRVALLPTRGLRGDLDQFALWVHGLATAGRSDGPTTRDLSFPPVMVYIWDLLAVLQPAFQTVSDGSRSGDQGGDEDAGQSSPTSGSGCSSPTPSANGPGWP